MSNKFYWGQGLYGLFLVGLCFAAGLHWSTAAIVTSIYLIFVVLPIYAMSPAWQAMFSAWIARNPWLFASGVLLGTCAFAYTVWGMSGSQLAVWIGRITFAASAFCFIKHGCVRRNWCTDVKAWWGADAVPAIKKMWGFRRDIRIVLRRKVWPMLASTARAMRPWVEGNFWLLLGIGFAWGASETYKGNVNWQYQSRLFWGLAGASFVSFLVYSVFLRRYVGKFLGWALGLPGDGLSYVWKEFQEKTAGHWKAITYGVAAVGLVLTSSFVMEIFQRNSGWFFKLIHLNMMKFDRITWSGTFMIAGIFALAVLILLGSGPYMAGKDKAEKKKPTKEEERIQKKKDRAIEKALRDEAGEKAVIAFRKAKKA